MKTKIRNLYDAAAEAGDMMQCAICEIADRGMIPDYLIGSLSDGELEMLHEMSGQAAEKICDELIDNMQD